MSLKLAHVSLHAPALLPSPNATQLSSFPKAELSNACGVFGVINTAVPPSLLLRVASQTQSIFC